MNLHKRIQHVCRVSVLAWLAVARTSVLAQAPSNDNLASATVLAGTNSSLAATTVGATAEPNEPAHAGFAAAHSVWFIWTAPGDGSTLIDLTGSAPGTHLAVYVGKYLSSLSLVSSNAAGNPDGTGRCTFHVSAGVLYDIAVDVSGNPGPVKLNLLFTRSCFSPQITQQPLDQTVVQGGTATFKVTSTSDCPLSYQWVYNQTNYLAGATDSVLALNNVSLNQIGQYGVIISNSGGSVTSLNADLTVVGRPPNDDFANRIPLSGAALSLTASDLYATAEEGEPAPVNWPSPQSVWWTWTAPTNGVAYVGVTNYIGNQVMVVYTGDALAQLVAVASGSWYSPPFSAQFEVSAGISYQITVAGVGGAGGAFQLDLSFGATNFPPVITQPPTNQTVLSGATVTFQVVADGALPLHYQWQFNGNPIAGATNAALVITNVSASQAGTYGVIVANLGGSASASCLLTVNVPPSNDDFRNRNPLSGLEVTAAGNNQFATSEPGEPSHGGFPPGASVWYTWSASTIGDAFVDLPSFTGSQTLGIYTGTAVSNLTLVASNSWAAGPLSVHFAATNPGTAYQIAVADPYGGGGSFQLHTRLAVSNFPPIVVQQPPTETYVTIGVSNYLIWVLQSDFPVTGQWFFDGVLMGGGGVGPGAGGAGGGGLWTGTLGLGDLTAADVGTNTVISIWTCYGGSVTNTNYVIVSFPPSNDNFTNRITLSGVSLTISGTTLHATLENGEPPYQGLQAGGSVWWTWTAPDAGTATISVTGANAGAQILAVFTGNAVSRLIGVSKAGPGSSSLSSSFATTAGATYQIAVVGGDASFQLNLQFLDAYACPVITQQPANLTVPAGGTANLSVGAVGGGVLSYQWRFYGTNLPGATSPTLTLTNLSTNQAGPYDVVVRTLGCSTNSASANLAVTLRPPNDNFVDRITLTGTNVTTTGSNQYGTSEPGEPSHANWGTGKSVWWTWTAPSDGHLRLSVTNFSGYQVLAVYTGASLAALSPVTNAIWFQGPMVAQFNVRSGVAYQIVGAGESGSGGAFELDLAFASSIFPPVITQQPLSQTVIEGSAASFSTVAAGAPPLTYQWQLNSTNLTGATNATLALTSVKPNQGGQYQVIVSNPGGSVTSSVATLNVRARPPNDDFVNRIPLAGDQVTTNGSNVFATSEPNEPAHAGFGPFQSVWWSYTPPVRGLITMDLSGSFYGAVLAVYTGANLGQLSLVASNASANLDGTAMVRFLGEAATAYQLAVQGRADGTVGSIHLSVSGDYPPTITAQPQNSAVGLGEDASFEVTAQSQSSLNYQWFFGNSPIPGATNRVLWVTEVSTNDPGQYYVLVRNDIGSVTSSKADLSLTTVLGGQVTDATTGDPLPGVLVWAGSVTNVSDTNGNYRLAGVQATATLKADFDAGVRSGTAPLSVQFSDRSSFAINPIVLRAETNGYYSYTNDQVTLASGKAVTNSFSLSPILPAGMMRLVLNWGADPRDLDANLLTPALQGQSYHIYYQTGSRGSLTNIPYAGLNVDRTNGFGPETITIEQFFPGAYTYYVHKYAGIGNIAGSGAAVKIYTDSGLQRTLVAPNTGEGDFWVVCTIDGQTHEITLVNEIQSAAPARSARRVNALQAPIIQGGHGGHQPMDLPPGTASFLWDFGDGNQSTLEDPINVYTNPGSYTVSLTVTTISNNLVQSEIKTNYIEVLKSTNQPPQVTLTSPANGSLFVMGTNLSLTAVAATSSGVVTQVLFFENATNLLGRAVTQPYSLVWRNVLEGSYALTAVATDNAGLNSPTSSVVNIKVDSLPTIRQQPTGLVVVSGTTVHFQVIADGTAPLSFQWYFNKTNALSGATNAILTLTNVQPAVAGGYSVLVSNPVGSLNSVLAVLGVLVPPSITSQPTNQTIAVGGTASFRVAAAGAPPLSYQWFFNKTNLLTGSISPLLTLVNAQLSSIGSYSAVVSNQAGVVTSILANLSVLLPPAIIRQPVDVRTNEGATVAFSVSATGNAPLAYQWWFNGANAVASGTSPTLTLPSVQASQAGRYSVTVSNAVGSVNSTSANLVVTNSLPVNQAPSFVKGPNLTLPQTAGPQTRVHWATAISAGPPNEATQTVAFTVTSDTPSLFLAQPALSPDGTLTFTPSPTAEGVALVTVVLKDNGGTANGGQDRSLPQSFTITVVGPRDVAIILASVDSDNSALTNDVSEVSLPEQQSLSLRVFERTGLDLASLALHKCVIWYDPVGTQPITTNEVALMRNLYSRGKPLIFLGPWLSSEALGLPADWQAAWLALVHLQTKGGSIPGGAVSPLTSQSDNLLPNGPYGTVGPFEIQTVVDQASVTSDADSLGLLTNGALFGDVIASYPAANAGNQDQVRTFSMLMPLDGPGDAVSFPMRKVILQNAICWVMQCKACPEVYPSFNYVVDPPIPQTGTPATISLTLGNGGECDGVAYLTTVQLDGGLRFPSASSDIGQVTTTNGTVYVNIGRIPARNQLTLTINITPVVPGWVTNHVHIQAAAANPRDEDVVFEVQGERIPELAIEAGGGGAMKLTLWANPGSSYAIERAILPLPGVNLSWSAITNLVFAPPAFQMQDEIQITNPGAIYRARRLP